MFGIKARYRSLKKRFAKKAVVLMYHSISEPDIDPWELAVSPVNFEQQLQVLQNRYTVYSIPDIVSLLRGRKIKNNCIAISFDDGYRNNFDIARPLLEKYKLPATFFITSENFNEGKIFWWDELASIILKAPALPGNLNLKIGKTAIYFSLEGERNLTDDVEQLHRQWVSPNEPPTERSKLYHKLWQLMQPLAPVELNYVLAEIKNWAGKSNVTMNAQNRIITKDQLQALADNSLFEIGAHTVNHIALSCHSAQVQEWEILQNRLDLEHIIKRKVTTIAYPYGEYNNASLDAAEKAGLEAGFSVEYNPVFSNSNPFHLGRFQVKNWNGEQFEEKLIKWLKQEKEEN